MVSAFSPSRGFLEGGLASTVSVARCLFFSLTTTTCPPLVGFPLLVRQPNWGVREKLNLLTRQLFTLSNSYALMPNEPRFFETSPKGRHVFLLRCWFGYAWLIAPIDGDRIHSEDHVWAY